MSPLAAVSTAAATTAMAVAATHNMQAAQPTAAPAPAAAAAEPALAAAASGHADVMPLHGMPKLTDEELAQRTCQIIKTADMRVCCTV